MISEAMLLEHVTSMPFEVLIYTQKFTVPNKDDINVIL